MGCGQSHISIIYPRKSKNKDDRKRSGEGSENEDDEKDEESDADSEERLRASRLSQMVPGPLLAQTEISSSQSDFFKMLDEKIERGPDYDSTCEYELAIEHARLCRLLQDWEMAKIRSRNRQAGVANPMQKTRYTPHINGSLHRHRYSLANSVVMYDQRGGYYTELA